jgi:hypothetical protein
MEYIMAKNELDKNVWLNIFWFVSGVIWLPFYILTVWMSETPKWIRWWGNRVDNLPDQLKEWIHCHRIPFTNKQINISVIMQNREPKTWDIIREHKYWVNCDPKDYQRTPTCTSITYPHMGAK